MAWLLLKAKYHQLGFVTVVLHDRGDDRVILAESRQFRSFFLLRLKTASISKRLHKFFPQSICFLGNRTE